MTLPVYRLGPELEFPPPAAAEPGGLLAVGGDLSPERLLLAYSQGIFPWYDESLPILWHSPDPRTVLVPSELHVPKSLAKTLRRRSFRLSLDADFARVIAACAEAPRPRGEGTWITDEMRAAYVRLHDRGFAHSVEAWRDGELAGGLYGVALGRCFFGESMFAHCPDASKVAFATLAEIRDHGGRGRWSDALGAFARELEARPGGPVVSLDWGFHAQLHLLAPELDLREPIWAMQAASGTFEMEGVPGTVYLVQDPRYHLFPFGDELLAAVSRLPEGAAPIRGHPDRSGENVFYSIRIDRPHHLARRDALEVVLD